jgi:hypothetical protein
LSSSELELELEEVDVVFLSSLLLELELLELELELLLESEFEFIFEFELLFEVWLVVLTLLACVTLIEEKMLADGNSELLMMTPKSATFNNPFETFRDGLRNVFVVFFITILFIFCDSFDKNVKEPKKCGCKGAMSKRNCPTYIIKTDIMQGL